MKIQFTLSTLLRVITVASFAMAWWSLEHNKHWDFDYHDIGCWSDLRGLDHPVPTHDVFSADGSAPP
jgi:hypothetical protein